MSARRTSSTTSLSKYAKAQTGEDDLANRSLDFCNAFWGIADGGYDVLLTRIRGAARTTEELRTFWKERAAIEDEYAKRLSKLAKQPLGRDEIGELRNSIDSLRLETDRQAVSHANLAQQMRKELEQPIVELLSKQAHFKKVSQAAIEKSFRTKQAQESYVKKARAKYEDDCVKINAFTAQSTLVQGKDLDRLQLKLEKAKQTVQSNEREFSQFARALADTTSKWEKEWKVFCDGSQDLEEERIEFIKDNMWGYANAVSTVCVSDDESCEKIRLALEQVEPDKDMQNFVRDYSTGPQIPEPPAFIDYNTLQAGQQPSRPSWRLANFARSSGRAVGLPLRHPQMQEEEPTSAGNAGIGANGARSRDRDNTDSGTSSRPNSAAATRSAGPAINGLPSAGQTSPGPSGHSGPSPVPGGIPTPQAPPKQGPSPAVTQAGPSQPSTTPQALSSSAKAAPSFRVPQTQEPHAEPIDPRAETMLRVGANAYPVNLGDDPQRGRSAGPSGSVGGSIGELDDPLAKQVAELRNASSGGARRGSYRGTSGPTRRGTGDAFQPPGSAGPSSSAPVASGSGSFAQNHQSAISPGPTSGGSSSQAAAVNYHAQAESVVGGLPPPPAGPASPNPPTASFMVPPKSPVQADDVVSSYQQSFPGEKRRSLSISRQNSVNRGEQTSPRPVSPAREGHVGIGAHGGSRSPSPQPPSRSSSPMPPTALQAQRDNYHAPPAQQVPARATSPLGIALDPNGHVAQDDLAERYNQQRLQQQQQQEQMRASFYGQGPPQQPQYLQDGLPTPGPQGSVYGQQQPPRQYPPQGPPPPSQLPPQPHQVPSRQMSGQLYNPHPPQNPQRQGTASSLYNPYSPAQTHPTPGRQASVGQSIGHQQYPSQPPPQPQSQPSYGYTEQPQNQARPPYSGYPQQQSANVYQTGGHPVSNHGDYGSHGYQASQPGYRAPSPAQVHRSPSPTPVKVPPTGQYTDYGEGVLFYVKALYDYQATIDEEFDFQAGDVIAVTATPEDGWWSGMLLDEMRRVPGKTIFPSNFVSLF